MRALIVVDLQNDFMPGGALPVPEGEECIAVANQAMQLVDLVVATRDHHPAGHLSFASSHPGKSPGDMVDLDGISQALWPDHCVAGTHGAELAAGLDTARIDHVTLKGQDPRVDSYSGFFDNHRRHATDLETYLRAQGVDELWILGVATDYCVKFTALDALDCGFPTTLLVDGCRGVNLSPGDADRAVKEIRERGVKVSSLDELVRHAPRSM